MSLFVENGKHQNKQPICNGCKNHLKGNKCLAFDFIPNLILSGEDNHKKPIDGQTNEIVFEPIEK